MTRIRPASAGPAGPTGPAGSNGSNGVGVPAGGTTGQVLAKTSNADYATGWTTPAGSGGAGGASRFRMLAGGFIYAPPAPAVPATTAASTTLYVVPFPIDVPPTGGINGLGVRVNTGVASSVVRLGVYADTGYGFPGARLVDAGTVSAATTATDAWASVTWSPTADLYWLAVLATAASANLAGMSGPMLGPALHVTSAQGLSTSPAAGFTLSGQSALPATFPSSGFSTVTTVPRPYLRTA